MAEGEGVAGGERAPLLGGVGGLGGAGGAAEGGRGGSEGEGGARGEGGDGASGASIFVNVLKGNLGPGCLSLPYAFSKAGAVLAPSAFFLIACAALYNMTLLLECRGALQRRGVACQTYGELAAAALGPRGKDIVDAFIAITQCGICCVYFVFLADSFPSEFVFRHELEPSVLILAGVPVMFLLMLPREVKQLAPFSAISNALLAVSLVWILICAGQRLAQQGGIAHDLTPARPGQLFLFVGNCVYSMEGIGLVLPIRNSAAHLEGPAFGRAFYPAMVLAFSTLLGVGLLCLLAFGEFSDGSVTAELLRRGMGGPPWALATLNAALVASVVLTYPLQARPAVEIFAERVLGHPPGSDGTLALKVALVAGTAAAACGVGNNLGLVIGVFGAGGSSVLALIMPPLIRLKVGKVDMGLWKQALLVATAAGGTVIGVGGTWVSVRSLVREIAAGA